MSDVVTSLQGTDTFGNSTTYYYNADATGKGVTTGGTYMGGAVTLTSTSVTKNNASQTGSTTTNTLAWWGGTLQAKTDYVSGSVSNTSDNYGDARITVTLHLIDNYSDAALS